MAKVCSRCKLEKPLEAFSKSKRYADGRQHRCKNCAKEFTQAATTMWRKNNPEKVKQSNRKTKLKGTYGVSFDELYQMLVMQGD